MDTPLERWNRTSTPVQSQMFELIQSVRRFGMFVLVRLRLWLVFSSGDLQIDVGQSFRKLRLLNLRCDFLPSPLLLLSHYLKEIDIFTRNNIKTNSARTCTFVCTFSTDKRMRSNSFGRVFFFKTVRQNTFCHV